MLKRLYIENFALVDKLEVTFETGFNILTGETGAGKSIIVGAISQLLGEKADKDDIRSGTKVAVIEGDFDIGEFPTLNEILEKNEVEFDGKTITLRKEIPENRASKSFINSQMITLAQLRTVTAHLAELFGQHSHQQLLDEKNHLAFMDSFAGINEQVVRLQKIYYDWQGTHQELTKLEANRESAKRERELLSFQKDEIERAQIRAGEEEELVAEKKILDSSHTLGEKSELILNMIDREDYSALSILNSCRKELADMVNLDKSLESKAELLEQAVINLDELRGEIESYQSSIPDDPNRLEQINLRLDEIYRLKKKYGGSEESILNALEEINNQLGIKIDVDEQIKILRKEESELKSKYISLAEEISQKRHKSSEKLSAEIEKELEKLGIHSSKFKFEFISEPDSNGIEKDGQKIKPLPEGFETGRFLISPNPGEPLKPMAKIASGGEISRIMLALKAVESKYHKKGTSLLVFDEIDAGIGGETAVMVGERLKSLADSFQLLVISHLHQIAGLARNHYAVEKKTARADSGRNIIEVKKLSPDERKKEIKRMISMPETIDI